MNIYQEELMDHFEHPRNKGGLSDFDLKVGDSNASCGDNVNLMVKISDDGVVEEVGWSGVGCAVSMAGMSKMSEWLRGKSLDKLKDMSEEELLREALSWRVNPGRQKCLELSVRVVKKLLVK